MDNQKILKNRVNHEEFADPPTADDVLDGVLAGCGDEHGIQSGSTDYVRRRLSTHSNVNRGRRVCEAVMQSERTGNFCPASAHPLNSLGSSPPDPPPPFRPNCCSCREGNSASDEYMDMAKEPSDALCQLNARILHAAISCDLRHTRLLRVVACAGEMEEAEPPLQGHQFRPADR